MDFLFGLPATAVVFLLGTSIGSFLNVVVYRLPANLSLLYPPSRCPHCLHRLGRGENLPIVGWLRLKGRCRHCRSPISARYPLVEAAMGVLFVLVFWVFGLSWQTVGYWTFVSWLLALALIDLDTLHFPNSLLQSGCALGLVFQAGLGWLVTGTLAGAIVQLMAGLIGAVVGLWLVELISLVASIAFGQTAMGAGDAKLAAVMGAWLGWKLMLLAGFVACAVGAIAGVSAIGLGLHRWRQTIPFGPFLALGAVLVLFWGDALVATYLKVFFAGV